MNKNNEIKNDIIIIGADHCNALGVIRSLGECGIRPIFILLNDTKKCMTAYSKYIKKYFVIEKKKLKFLFNFY